MVARRTRAVIHSLMMTVVRIVSSMTVTCGQASVLREDSRAEPEITMRARRARALQPLRPISPGSRISFRLCRHASGMTIGWASAAACLHLTSSPRRRGSSHVSVSTTFADRRCGQADSLRDERKCSMFLLRPGDLGSRRHDEVMLRMNAGMTLRGGARA